jgi:hypothetical protein
MILMFNFLFILNHYAIADNETGDDEENYTAADNYEGSEGGGQIQDKSPEPAQTTEIQEKTIPQPITKQQGEAISDENEVLKPVPVQNTTNSVNTKNISPTQPSNAYIDSDQDGVPDSIDKHPGFDDFAYAIIDANQNGIADDLEILAQ